MVDPGFLRQGYKPQMKCGDAYLLFGQKIPEDCMVSLVPTLDPTMAWMYQLEVFKLDIN